MTTATETTYPPDNCVDGTWQLAWHHEISIPVSHCPSRLPGLGGSGGGEWAGLQLHYPTELLRKGSGWVKTSMLHRL